MSKPKGIEERLQQLHYSKESSRLKIENLKRKTAILSKEFKRYNYLFPVQNDAVIKQLQNLANEVIVN